MEQLLKLLPVEQIVSNQVTAQPEIVNVNASNVNVFTNIIIIIIILLLISSVSVILNIWLDKNEERKQNIKDTYTILFGNNIILTILLLLSLYFIYPLISVFIIKINSLLLDGAKEGITEGVSEPIKKLFSKLIKKTF